MNKTRKGIILAGGNGTRLSPLTMAISKQLMPIYNKPMIYYPINTLISIGIIEILIICNPHEIESFKRLLKDGSQWGISIQFAIQIKPNGIAEAFIIAEEFLNSSPSVLILGDNIFHGFNLVNKLKLANNTKNGATIFCYQVSDPERYGIVEFDKNKKALSIIEKPISPKSNFAITGIYFFDEKVIPFVKKLQPSKRGELEITDVNNFYLKNYELSVQLLDKGVAWLDTGTFDSLQEAGQYISSLQKRQGVQIGSPDETAWQLGLISDDQLEQNCKFVEKSDYGKYLIKLLH